MSSVLLQYWRSQEESAHNLDEAVDTGVELETLDRLWQTRQRHAPCNDPGPDVPSPRGRISCEK